MIFSAVGASLKEYKLSNLLLLGFEYLILGYTANDFLPFPQIFKSGPYLLNTFLRLANPILEAKVKAQEYLRI